MDKGLEKRRGWVTASGEAVKNKDLWLHAWMRSLLRNIGSNGIGLKVTNGNPGNERADALASQGALRARSSALKTEKELEIPVLRFLAG